MSTYTLKTWDCFGKSRIRQGLPYAFAYAMATRGGFDRAQVIDAWGVICLEIVLAGGVRCVQ